MVDLGSDLFSGEGFPAGYGSAATPAVRLAPGGRSVYAAPQAQPTAYGARWAPASPDQPRPATIPGNNQGVYVAQASGPQSPNTGNYAAPRGYGAPVAAADRIHVDPTNPARGFMLASDGSITVLDIQTRNPIAYVSPKQAEYKDLYAIVTGIIAKRRVDPALIAQAILAAGTVANTAIAPGAVRRSKKKSKGKASVQKFDTGAGTTPASSTPASSMWVWVGGGVALLAVVGGIVYAMSRPAKSKSSEDRE